MTDWRAGDTAHPVCAAKHVRETVVQVTERMVRTEWVDKCGGWHAMQRSREEMDRYMERVS